MAASVSNEEDLLVVGPGSHVSLLRVTSNLLAVNTASYSQLGSRVLKKLLQSTPYFLRHSSSGGSIMLSSDKYMCKTSNCSYFVLSTFKDTNLVCDT